MGKKLIKKDGKTYLLDDEMMKYEEIELEQKQEDEEKLEGDTKEGEEESKDGEEENEDEEKEEEGGDEGENPEPTEKNIQEAADKVVSQLGLDKIRKDLKELQSKVKDKIGKRRISELLDLEVVLNKSKDEMTTEEKVIGFFQAMVRNDKVALKALAEGVAADGGYGINAHFKPCYMRESHKAFITN